MRKLDDISSVNSFKSADNEFDVLGNNERSSFSRLTIWLINKRYFVVFVLLAVLATGFCSYARLPMEAFPDVANMQVRVIWM
jgi:hypothetical protein